MGYGPDQVEALRACLDAAEADVVVGATPVNLAALMTLDKPLVRARYEFAEAGEPTLASLVDAWLDRPPATAPPR